MTLIVSAAAGYVAEPETQLLSGSAMSSDEEDWVREDLVKVDKRKEIEVKRVLFDLRGLCRVKSRKILESLSVAAGLAVKVFDNTVGLLFSGAQIATSSCIDKLNEQIAMARASVVSFTAKLSDLKDVHDTVQREHKELVEEIQIETETGEDHILAKYFSTFFRYHDVLRACRGIDKAADRREGSRTDTLT